MRVREIAGAPFRFRGKACYGQAMLLKALLVIAALFSLGFAARFIGVLRGSPWLAPMLAGGVTYLMFYRFGLIGIAAAAAAAGAAWWITHKPVAAPITDEAAARAVLGVGVGATAADIRAAHRAAIVNAHPDKGGSPGRAAELNAARDLLLKQAAKTARNR